MGRQSSSVAPSGEHGGEGRLSKTLDGNLSAFLSLPSELLLEILQYSVDWTWEQNKASCLDLRRTCRTLDDVISRIVFPKIDRDMILKRKPLLGRQLKWLLFTRAKIQYNKREGLFATIHTSVAWISSQQAFNSDIFYTYDDYLDAACRAIVARHEHEWILQNAIFDDSISQHNSFGAAQKKEQTVEKNLGQDVTEVHTSEMANGALHLAASLGNVPAVALLLATGVNPNQSHALYGYSLIAAVFSGRIDIVRLFIEHGADLNVRPLIGEPPLVLAAQRNFKDIVDLLSKDARVRVNNSCKNGLTALIWAARRGWLDTSQTLLGREETDPDPLTAWGDSPIAAAIKNGNDDIARLLIKRLDVEPHFHAGVHGQLLAATRRGSWELVHLLLDRYKLDPNMHLRADKSLLGLAVYWRHRTLVDLLLQREDIDPNYRKKDTYPTPLMIAIDNGDIGMVEILVTHKGLNPNLVYKGFAPLAKAIRRFDDQMAQMLLRRTDVDVSVRIDELGDAERTFSMLSLAALKGTHGTVRSLLSHPGLEDLEGPGNDQPTPLLAAISRGNTKVVEELLKQHDVDPNRPSSIGRLETMTPLQHAVRRGNRKIVQLLLNRNDVDVNKTGQNHHTPLELAVLKEEAPRLMALLLTRADVDINKTTEIKRSENWVRSHRMSTEINQLAYNFKEVGAHGVGLGGRETILLVNTKEGRLGSVTQLMQDERINPNIGDAWGRTPLWWAAREGYAQIVKQLIELGNKIKPSLVNVNAQDVEGWTPLLCAVNRDYELIVATLLKRPEIDPNLANREGWTPLHLSVARENEKIVKQLLAHPRTNVWAKLKVGRTALQLTGPGRRRIFNAVKAREIRDAGQQ